MQYQQAREHIRSGDLIAFRKRELFSWAVRMRTGSDYSHVGVALRMKLPQEPREGVYLVDSAARAGFRIRRLSTLKEFDWIALPAGAGWSGEAAAYVGRRLGVYAYGWADILRAALGFPMREDAHQTCQEFAAAVLRLCHLPVGNPQSPGELVDTVRRHGDGRITLVKVK